MSETTNNTDISDDLISLDALLFTACRHVPGHPGMNKKFYDIYKKKPQPDPKHVKDMA